MRVLIWNMGRRDDEKAWRHALDDHHADLVLAQETTPPGMLEDRGHQVHARAYPQHSWGSCVFAREGRLKELPLPDAHRGFLVAAELSRPDTTPLVAVSIHARIVDGYVRPNLDQAFDALTPLLEGQRFIVGGDFNLSRNYDRAYKTKHHTEFLDEVLPATGMVNAFTKFHAEEKQTFWGRTKIAYQDDHVYVSADLADGVVDCDVVSRDGYENLSDHSALLLELDPD